MRKFLRLGVAALLAASGLMAVTTASSASIPVIPCPGPDVNPGVTVPPTVPPPLGGKELVGPEDPCADLVRTLVFVGVANITNGVNFAGTGNGTAAGGTFTFTGNLPDNPVGCAMVNWEDPDNSSAPADQPTITDCFFSLTNGTYTGPTQPNPIVNPIGRCIEFGAQLECAASPGTPGYTGLDWAPGSQASCFNSSGSGSSSFTSVGVDGTMEIWASNGPFTWENSLDNLRGSVSRTAPGALGPFDFDAKIETNAWPLATSDLDKTAAGCLSKTVEAVNSTTDDVTQGGTNYGAGVGLNEILVVGTATWKTTLPTIL